MLTTSGSGDDGVSGMDMSSMDTEVTSDIGFGVLSWCSRLLIIINIIQPLIIGLLYFFITNLLTVRSIFRVILRYHRVRLHSCLT
jgi:hypothetical protein